MRRPFLYYLIISTLIFLNGCISPFTPEGINTTGGTLVVEGDIILNDTTRVFLSSSIPLDQNNTIAYITNATVWVESEGGSKYVGALKQNTDLSPHYAINTNGLNPNDTYKLCVTLSDGRNYESDLLDVLASPPIDSIGFIVNSDRTAVSFYVNTYGDNNASRYYKWRYREDWEIHSYFRASCYYDLSSGEVLPFQGQQNVYFCWCKDLSSSSILIAKTDQLANNVVYQKSLNTIENTSKKISYLYSIGVSQLSISEESYKYWSTVEKNSDNIGGLFPPQPSELAGNIHCLSNPDEKVLGYISAGISSSKRAFVSNTNVGIYRYYEECELVDDPKKSQASREELYDNGYEMVSAAQSEDSPDTWSTKECVDCRLYGTKDKPSFWPNDDI